MNIDFAVCLLTTAFLFEKFAKRGDVIDLIYFLEADPNTVLRNTFRFQRVTDLNATPFFNAEFSASEGFGEPFLIEEAISDEVCNDLFDIVAMKS